MEKESIESSPLSGRTPHRSGRRTRSGGIGFRPSLIGEGVRPGLFAVKLDFPMVHSLFESLLGSVSEARRQRADRFLQKEDSCRSVVGEALALWCIGQREHVSKREISFSYNEHGKPGLNLPGKTQFNVSHSGQWVVCAIDDRPIGVDVERIHDVDLDISKRFFSSAENEDLANFKGEAKKERFFEYWSLKESYIKAIGKGLFCSLGSFTVVIGSGLVGMNADPGMPMMFLKQYDIGPSYKCALCAEHDDLPEKIVFVKAEELASPGLWPPPR